MSRTIRRSSITDEKSKASYVKNELSLRRSTGVFAERSVRVRKPKEQYETEKAQARAEAHAKYLREIAHTPKDEFGRHYRLIPQYNCVTKQYYHTKMVISFKEPYIYKYDYKTIKIPVQQLVKDYEDAYDRYTRDGYLSETGRKTGFKKACARKTRIANKRLEKAIVAGLEYDLPYPNEHDVNYLRWSYW